MFNQPTLAVMALIGSISAQSIFKDIPMPGGIEDTIGQYIKPVTDVMEPYKVFSKTDNERGVPVIHDAYGK